MLVLITTLLLTFTPIQPFTYHKITNSHLASKTYHQQYHQSPPFPNTPTSPPHVRHPKTHLSSFIDDHYFLIEGIVTGIVLNVATSASRIVSAQDGWEERVKAARVKTASDDLTELELMAEVAAVSPSKYGPEAEQRREIRRAIARGDYDEEREREDFESMYGLKYDPYYEEPYEEDELPSDVSYNTDPFFGDRIYENGDMFFKEGKVFYRKGGRPRMKFFWD